MKGPLLTRHQDSAYPLVDVVFNATGSYAGTCVLIVFLLILLFFSAVSTVASSSRQIWSFARDHVSSIHQTTEQDHVLTYISGLPIQ